MKTAVTPRTGVFSSERELQLKLANCLRPFAEDAREIRVRREMPVGSCIPDLVLVSMDSEPPTALWPTSWSYRHACVVAELRKRPALRPEMLAARLHESEERIGPVVQALLRAGAVCQSAGGALYLASEVRALRADIVAVEAKLMRWHEALEQALSYRAFADRAVVAMDAGMFSLSNEKALDAFRDAGVGLWLVNHDGAWPVIAGRRRAETSAWREYVCSSAFLPRTQTLWMRR